MYYSMRYLCDVLDEMRQCDKTKNYASLLGLIEEAQSMGNRMEQALGDKKDLERLQISKRELRIEVKTLERQKELLEIEIKELEYSKKELERIDNKE